MIPPVNGLHIEPTNICTLKCSGCARTRFIDQWPQHWKNHSVSVSALMRFLDIELDNKTIYLCGNYGDPIYHPEFIELVTELKNRKTHLIITTNGSYKKQNWWYELTQYLDSGDTVIFSVDGTPENFTQYRVNGDWESIKQAMEICVASKCKTAWKYIPFSYNQTDIGSAREISNAIGIDEFKVEYSDRFDEQTQHLIPAETLMGAKWTLQSSWKKQTPKTAAVTPKCKNGIDHFITADGFYSPCCFIADHRFYYKTIFGKQKKLYNIQEFTLSQILSEPTVINFYQTLDSQASCQFNCPG
jgi:pyruvate-formate lyase-activating enzyme